MTTADTTMASIEALLERHYRHYCRRQEILRQRDKRLFLTIAIICLSVAGGVAAVWLFV